MDKLIFTNAAQGMEQSFQNLQTLQRSVLDGIEATIRAMIPGYDPDAVYVVHGCAVTVDGSDYEVTAGVLFHNGELFAVAATSFTSGGGEVGVFKLNVVAIETPFANGIEYEVEQTRTIIFESAATGTGVADFDELVDPELANALKKSGGVMTGDIDLDGHKLKNADIQQGVWTTFALDAGWTAHPDFPCQYRKDKQGRVNFRGRIRASGTATSVIISASGSNKLPIAVSPPEDASGAGTSSYCYPCIAYVGGTIQKVGVFASKLISSGFGGLSINTDDWAAHSFDTTLDYIWLETISYDTEPFV